MSGYGYSSSKKKDKKRDRSDSTPPRDRDKKRKDNEKDKADDRGRDRDRRDKDRKEVEKDRDRTKDKGKEKDRGKDRSRSRDRKQSVKDSGKEKGKEGRYNWSGDKYSDTRDKWKGDANKSRVQKPPSPKSPSPKKETKPAQVAKPKTNWRDEIAKEEEEEKSGGGDDDDDDEDDDAKAQKALEASRKRREALMKSFVTVGEGDDKNGKEGAKAEPVYQDGSDSEESGADGEKAKNRPGSPDAETMKKNEEINAFRYKQKEKDEREDEDEASMFNEKADESKLKQAHKNTTSDIQFTGASAEDWDDEDGYYRAKVGEVIDGRYLVVDETSGKGVFSNVVKAKDQQHPQQEMVAIKVMRCNDMMKKCAEKEIDILETLNKNDKENKKHVIRLLRHFSYRGHLCLVFECMWDSLRAALKKYTKDKGVSLQAVRAYTKQLATALKHIHKCSIIHADLKPDNILISAGHNMVKICDLGTAFGMEEKVEITPYLLSRYYRPPEVILGREYHEQVDTFALGATLFELFTGKILLPGKTNNDMLRLMMELKGKIPHKMIKGGLLWKNHFDENLAFLYKDKDKHTGEEVVRTINDCSVKKDLTTRLMERVSEEKRRSKDPEDELYVKKVKQFADLIGQMLHLDPEKRVSPNDALKHPFLVEPMTLSGQKEAEAEADGKKGGKGKGKDKGEKKEKESKLIPKYQN